MLCSQWLPSPQRRQTEQGTLQIHQPRTRLIRQRLYAAAPQVVGHHTVTIFVCLGIFVGSIFLMKGVGTGSSPPGQRPHRSGSAAPIGSRVEYAREGDLISLDSLLARKYRNRRVAPTPWDRQVPTTRSPRSPTTARISSA